MEALAEEVRREAVRRLEEGRGRIRACVARLNEDQLWHRPNAHVVGVGNLVLHLAGNVGQWINATLGGEPDQRQRADEFNETGPFPASDLLERLDRTLDRAVIVIKSLAAEDLVRIWAVQGFQETGVAIVLHVVEHFSYHTGQITLHTKLLLDVDTGYYAGHDLDAKG
ncbi:MAG: DinB family protein [Flavobacteriales bacterium]